jgi:YVTN family beta-propeller protein
VKVVGVVVSPDGARVYVTTSHANGVAVVDPKTNALLETIPVGGRPWGVALSPDGGTIFTANGASGDVSIIDVSAGRVVASVRAGDGPWGVAVAR